MRYHSNVCEQDLQKIRKNKTGWRVEDWRAAAEENFVEWRRLGRGGSHVGFSCAGCAGDRVPAPASGLHQAIRGADRRCWRNKVRATKKRNHNERPQHK